jgi:PPOX class probable F420-dependent enzyme
MTVRATALTAAQRRFLDDKRFAVVGTKNPDGSPHLAVMWYLIEGDEIVLNSAQGRIKDRNLALDPRLSVMVADGYTFIRIDGRARIEHDQTLAHADIRRLAARYYEDEHKVEEAMRANFGKQHRISYRLPIRRVISGGF